MAAPCEYRSRIATLLLGKPGLFPAYFKLYDELFQHGTGGHIIQVDQPLQPGRQPIDHDTILTAATMLKKDTKLTPDTARSALQQHLLEGDPLGEFEFVMNMAVQAMFMIDANLNNSHSAKYTNIEKYRYPSWAPSECFVDFVNRCFPQVSTERRSKVEMVLEDKKSLKAWKLEGRLGIVFRGTDNLADHLLFTPDNRVLYLFHHAAYLKAHLDLWSGQPAVQGVGITTALERGTLSPTLLAETLHSLQSILFRYDDERSMVILQRLIKKKDFDEACCIHEGYKVFRDTAEDFQYMYWGERLAMLHDLVLGRPPQTSFQRWIRWQTSESNSFLIAISALVISIVVGIFSLGLSGFQAWVAWQAWKYPA